jgi:hypothetical protein
VNLPALFAHAAAESTADSSRTDNGNCGFLHYVRIPCGPF